jgi:hypothetical protein
MTASEVPVADRPHVVYRAYGFSDVLLYVGCTVDFKMRMHEHRQSASWLHYCKHITLEPFADMASARAAERDALLTECPVFNQIGNGGGGGSRRSREPRILPHVAYKPRHAAPVSA